jgi:negative regulator of flagellin synthesis FlgM
MANTINGLTGIGAASVGTGRTNQQTTKTDTSPVTANPQSEGGDEVQITNTASKLAGLGDSLSKRPAVDSARVARISAALADGTYKVSAQSIANGLMQSDHALKQIGL